MLRSTTIAAATALLVALSISAATPAMAAPIVTSTFSYTMSNVDPLTDSFPSYASDCSVWDNWTNSRRSAVTLTGTVSTTGAYTFTDGATTPPDGYIAIFAGTYDPVNVTNCLKAIDSSGTVTLTSGTTYTILGAGRNLALGTFHWNVTGPGEFATSAKDPTTTSLSASASRVTEGQTIDFTASVETADPQADLTGTINYYSGSTLLGTGTIDTGDPTHTFSALLPAGTHTIDAVYSGTSTLFVSYASAVVEVEALPTPEPSPEPEPAPELAATGSDPRSAFTGAAAVGAMALGIAMLLARRRNMARETATT